jgi:hypothetical protein
VVKNAASYSTNGQDYGIRESIKNFLTPRTFSSSITTTHLKKSIKKMQDKSYPAI